MFQNIPPITKNIIIINAIVFVATHYLFPNLLFGLAAYFPQSPNFHSWQIVTHMFMHGGWMHLLFNMFTLYSFGPILEQVIGPRKFLWFYFVCGLGSFALYNAWNYYEVAQLVQSLVAQEVDVNAILMKSTFENRALVEEHLAQLPNTVNKDEVLALYSYMYTPMVGASGAIFGVVAAFATLFPNTEMIFMFIPFPIKAKYLFPMILAGSVVLGVSQLQGDHIAHFAHVGGAIIGFLWILWWRKHGSRWS